VNYGVLSCCSCKAFFRRYAIHEKKYQCLRRKELESYSNKTTIQHTLCPTNVQTRNICKRCRMDKCLFAGMKKELILVRKRADPCSSDINNKLPKNHHHHQPTALKKSFKRAKLKENGHDYEVADLNNKPELQGNNLQLAEHHHHTIVSYHQTLNDHHHNHHPHQNKLPNSCDEAKTHQNDQRHLYYYLLNGKRVFSPPELELTTTERGRLFEVQHAFSAARFPEENSLSVVPLQPFMDVRWVLGLSALYVRKVVAFCKRMAPFRALPPLDQLLLLKAYIPSTLLVRSAFLFQPERGGWNWLADDSDQRVVFINGELFKAKRQRQEVVMPDKGDLMRSLHDALENDSTILNLVQATLLFRLSGEKRQKVNSCEAVHYQQVFYCYLLRRYLESKYGSSGLATTKLNTILGLLQQMDSFNEAMAGLHRQIHNHQNHHHHHHHHLSPYQQLSARVCTDPGENKEKEDQLMGMTCSLPEELIEVFDLRTTTKTTV
ncbi:Ligand binding domain of hormone receptors protein, partial [Tyrophagus putrescentiae]